jgi:uncharacterized membrane protein YkoI
MIRSRLSLLLAVAGLLAVSCAWADDDVPLEKAPPGVRATVKRLVGANKLAHLDKDVENGKTVYEVDVEAKAGNFSAHMSEGGDVLGISLDIPMEAVPEAVTAAAAKAHPGVKPIEPEIRTENGVMAYKLELKVGKVKHEMLIDASGNVLSDESEAEGGDDKEKEKK